MVHKDITSKYEVQKRSLIDLLESVDSVSVTVDLWSDRKMRSYLGITVHFMESNTLSTALLSCEQFEGMPSCVFYSTFHHS